MKVSDVDLDGPISAADSLLIMKYIVKMIAELPV
jgi:glutamine synthetase